MPNGLSARLKSFQHHIPLYQDNAYPYTCPPDKSNLVFYIEYRGSSAPPVTIGAVGDVYLDTMPGNYKFYFRQDSNSWLQWIPDEKHLKKDTFAMDIYEHPFLTDIHLWVVETGLIWYAVGKTPFRSSKAWKSISSWTFQDEPMGRHRKCPRPQRKFDDEDAVEGFEAHIAAKKSRVTEKPRENGSGSKPPQHQISDTVSQFGRAIPGAISLTQVIDSCFNFNKYPLRPHRPITHRSSKVFKNQIISRFFD
jgi:hypothetical protein